MLSQWSVIHAKQCCITKACCLNFCHFSNLPRTTQMCWLECSLSSRLHFSLNSSSACWPWIIPKINSKFLSITMWVYAAATIFLHVYTVPLYMWPASNFTNIGSPSQEVYHEKHIQKFWEENRNVFNSFKVVGPEENLSQGEARNMGMYVCLLFKSIISLK